MLRIMTKCYKQYIVVKSQYVSHILQYIAIRFWHIVTALFTRWYRASQRDKFLETQTDNLKVFWDEIRNLKPGQKSENIKGVYTENGNISHNPDIILAKWKSDFLTLFNPDVNISDDSFLNRVDDLMRYCEAELQC